jgi:hypothetical protein
MADLWRKMRDVLIWIAFGVGIVFATRPVWASLLFGPQLTLDDILLLRCFGLPS